MGDAADILYMFVRPREPLCVPKGKEKVHFKVPANYMLEGYQQDKADKITQNCRQQAFRTVEINPVDCTDCSIPMMLGRDQQFSIFKRSHRRMAGKLVEIFLNKKSCQDFMSIAAYCRDRANPNMFVYALSVAILHHSETKHLAIPSLCGIFPQMFIDSVTLANAKEKAHLLPGDCSVPIVVKKIRKTADDFEVEQRVAYFREDLGVNLHHWHWHTVYPYDGPIDTVKKDRRGELFYYMHQQILGRYDFERLSNYLMRVKSLNNWRDPISEGYFSKLGCDSSSRFYPGRQSGVMVKDVARPGMAEFELQDLERSRDRIYEAIHRREIIDTDGNVVKLTETDGIDILGDIVEASRLSPNPILYGDLHNSGHVAISSCHDPENHHLEEIGVMGNNATAMRDPVFYRWHAFIDRIFQEHKKLLPPYTKEQLIYAGIDVDDVEIIIGNKKSDIFKTHWQHSDIDISYGLDFTPTNTTLVRVTHLQHEPFTYKITVTNNHCSDKVGTVRIFMAPRLDESGLPFSLDKQRRMMIELDKFTWTFATGKNTVMRGSHESSVTIPYEQTFPRVAVNKDDDEMTKQERNFCGCGWPQHMLIPKGNATGLSVDFFVMVSNFDDDNREQGLETRTNDAASFCGLRDKKYPDARAMGYPFDRPIRDMVDSSKIITFEQFLTNNMKLKQMKIVFTDRTPPPEFNNCPESPEVVTIVQGGKTCCNEDASNRCHTRPDNECQSDCPRHPNCDSPECGECNSDNETDACDRYPMSPDTDYIDRAGSPMGGPCFDSPEEDRPFWGPERDAECYPAHAGYPGYRGCDD